MGLISKKEMEELEAILADPEGLFEHCGDMFKGTTKKKDKKKMSTEETKDRRRDPKPGEVFSTGLWKKVSKNGLPFLSGQFESYYLAVFSNKNPNRGTSAYHSMLKITSKEAVKEAMGSTKNPFHTDSMAVCLYRKESKAGNVYLGGIRDDIRYHVYTVTNKKNPAGPDYNLVAYDLTQDTKYVKEGGNKKLTADQGLPDVESDGKSPDDEINPDLADPYEVNI